MSIIITTLFRNDCIHMASDKRAKKDGVIIDENFKKIYQLNPNLLFGMTGTVEAGLRMLEFIISLKGVKSVRDLIDKVDYGFQSCPVDLTITLAGKDENDNYFVWQKNSKGEVKTSKLEPGEVQYFVSAGENIDEFKIHFEQEVLSTGNLEMSVRNTIKYASTVDDSINNIIDYYVI